MSLNQARAHIQEATHLHMVRSIREVLLPLHNTPRGRPAFSSWKSYIRGRWACRWVGVLIAFVVVLTFFLVELWDDPLRNQEIKDSRLSFGLEPTPQTDRHNTALPSPTQTAWDQRKSEVRNAYAHALGGYMKYAYPYDELRSVTGGKVNKCVECLTLF